jgi:hypothetical protein
LEDKTRHHPFPVAHGAFAMPERRFPPPWSLREELAAMSDTRPMTPEQAATLKQLAKAAYELDAFKPNLTRAEADIRIAALKAKLKLLNGPPHTL